MSSVKRQLRSLVAGLAGRQIVVCGDVILDEYLVGHPSRISREAPVLVLEFSRRFCRAGGAANPAVNIQALGSTARLVAAVGDDAYRQTLCEELARAGLSSDDVVTQSGARTTAKTRLLAEDAASRQHVARLDYPAPPPDAETRAALAERLRAAGKGANALLLSDYKGGVIDPACIALARELGREYGLITTADSQGDLARFAGLDLVKCNLAEAEATVGRPLRDDATVESAARDLLAQLDVRSVVITRGPDGLTAVGRNATALHLPAANRTEVFDVTGAGDTVIAVLTLALVAGASLAEAAQLANAAAGLVVRRLGVATTSPEELADSLD
jgi:D-glycero-beta-D-manno-heptose-7-phosphate kinase